MIKNKINIRVVSLLFIALFASGAMAITPVITTEGAITTGDKTPDITFTPVGNNASYVCTLYIGNATGFETAAGSATVSNNTLGTITCDRALAKGTYTYYVSMYNAGETPDTTVSSNAELKISTMGSIISILDQIVNMFTPLLAIVIKIIPIFVTLAMLTFVIGVFAAVFSNIQRRL